MKTRTGLIFLLILFLGAGGCRRGPLKPDQVAIDNFSPKGALEKPEDIEIQFTRQVIKPEQVGRDIDAALIEISPQLEKNCRWHSQSVARCYLRGQLPGKSYKVEVSKSIIPKESGFKLVGQRDFSFSLAGFKVVTVSTRFLSYTDPPRYGIEIQFNQEVDSQELLKHLKILAPDGNELPVSSRSWSPSACDLETYLNGYYRSKWTYITLKIDPDLPNKARNSTLKQAYTKTIDLPVIGALKITKSEFVQRDRVSFIQICFSSNVDSDALAQYLTITPAVDYRIEGEHQCSNLVGNFLPEEAYTINIKKGLKSSITETLEKDYTDTIQMADLQPYMSLIGSGHYLPRKGAMNLGLETINTDKVYIRVKKIFPNNLIYFLEGGQDYYCGGYYDEETDNYTSGNADECKLNRNLEILGKQILEKDMTIAAAKNKIVTTTLSLDDLVGKERKGIYAVGIYKNKDAWYSNAFVWMIATDLGIVAQKSDDDLIILVRSLETLGPLPGVKVKLFSKNNQLMAETITDSQGMAKFQNLAQTFKDFVPYLIIAESGDDFAFLSFAQAGVNTSSFDVSGDQYISTSYEAFLYPERDVYRPGETAHLAYLIRDANLSAPASFPVTLKVTSPDNRIFTILKSQPDQLMSGEFSVPFPREMLTGAYAFELYGPEDKALGSARIRAEEFMPDRIKVALSADKPRYLGGEPIKISVKANYLFGPPAAKQRSTASCAIEERPVGFTPYSEFSFGDQMQDYLKPLNFSLGEQELDDQGAGSYTCQVPANLRPRLGGLSATVQVSVFEPGGGRAVTGRKVLDVDPYPVYAGIRRDFKGEPGPNEEMKFSIIAVDPAGKPVAGRELAVRFYKREWHSVLRLEDRRYRYVSEEKKNLLQEKKITSGKDSVAVSFSSPSYGDFLIEVEDVESTARSAAHFYVWGWGYAPWAMENPDRIDLTLDKKEYLPGEEAKVLVKAPFSGKLILMVMTDKLLDYKEYDLSQNTATLKVPVRDDMKPNAYVAAILLRSFKSVEKFAPLRAVGIAPVKLNSSPRRLAINLTAPKKIRSNTALEVGIEVPAGAGGKVSLAAVDEGILQLTGFSSPDPLSYYYRKRRLPYDLYDIYSMILPEVVPAAPRSPFGGEISRERLKRELAPLSAKRVKPVSLWSGLINLDAQGRAKIKFDVPQFNGTLRLMAVSFTRDKMAAAESSVIVRDPITITSSLPRFLAPEDKFFIPVTIFNGTGKRGEFAANIETLGKVKINAGSAAKVFLEKDGEGTVRFEAAAAPWIGTDKITIVVSGSGEKSTEQTEIAIRPPYPLYSKTDVVAVSEGKPASFQFPSSFVEGTQNFKISAGSMPLLKYSESLKYLVHYPYGCIEQTTSGAFPLLYFKDLARLAAPELFRDGSVDYFVNEGVQKLVSMNMPDGQFSFWPDGGYPAYPWASTYATHYLIEAKKAGYNVPEIIIQRALDYQWRFSNTHRYESFYDCDETAYSLYVLSLGGRPNQNAMDWMLKRECIEKSLEPRTLLAGAYALKGDMETANKLLPVAANPVTEKLALGRTFYTPARAYAFALNILLDSSPNNPAIPGLVKLLSDSAQANRWYNTQENAYALLALGKFYRGQEKADYKGTITIGKNQAVEFEPKGTTLTASNWGGQNVEIKIAGKGSAYLYWEASGIPATPPEIKAESQGIEIERKILDSEDGSKLDLSRIPQGSLVVVKISMRAMAENLDNVAMADLLPAGLEIENPRLLTSARPNWITGETRPPQYMDIRDDRMITFQSLNTSATVFYYAARAVTAGTFVLPAVKAEAMYDPSYRAITEPGKLTIVERK